MLLDFRFATRSLAKSPGFCAIVILTLALGIGATTAIFSVVHATLLRPLPYPNAERIVSVLHVHEDGSRMGFFSDANFKDLRDETASFAALAEYSSWTTTALNGQQALQLRVATVSKQFFAAMGVQPVHGRGFSAEEMKTNGNPVVLVSHAYWKNSLGGAEEFAGKQITFDKKVYSIIGVLPQGFGFPAESDLWIPLEQMDLVIKEANDNRLSHNWYVVGRLKPDLSLQQAQLDASRAARAMKARYGKDTSMSDAALIPLRDALLGSSKNVLLLLLGAAGVLLMAACANTANLLLVRAASRRQELAVRAALGATQKHLLSQFFTEACLLSFTGGALGVLFAYWSVNALLGLGQNRLPGVDGITINLPILAFSIAVSFLTATGLSLLLALRAGRRSLLTHIKQGEQRQTGGARDSRIRAVLMTAQIAIATLLLAGAGLLARSLLHVMEVQPGYRTDNVLTADIFLSANDVLDFFREPGAKAARANRAQLLGEIERRVQAIPGVDRVGLVRDRPLNSVGMSNGSFWLADGGSPTENLEDLPTIFKLMHNQERTGHAWYQAATGGYFPAMQIPLKQGRLFDDRDTANAQHVAIISETLAKLRWPNQNPIGRRIQFGTMDGDLRLMEIVGIVGDVRTRSLETEPEPTIYVSAIQRAPTQFSLIVHTTASPLAVIPTIRATLHSIDRTLLPQFQLYPQVVDASFGERRFQLALLGLFAGGALLLAALGLYGVTSYMVAERTREIGVRMALGARASHVLRLVLRQGAVAVIVGIALGICAELALSGVLRNMLYGVSSNDGFTLASVGILLAGLAAIACWVPARRATKVDPLVALRAE